MPGATVSRTKGENADQSSARATQSQSANPKRTAKTRFRWMWAELKVAAGHGVNRETSGKQVCETQVENKTQMKIAMYSIFNLEGCCRKVSFVQIPNTISKGT